MVISRSLLRVLMIMFILSLLPGCRSCQRTKPANNGVSLSINNASAKRTTTKVHLNGDGKTFVGKEYVDFKCVVELNNGTGLPLTVKSNFFSAFDGLTLVVIKEDGKELARRGYTFHQSPYSIDRSFKLPVGVTKEVLYFPMFDLPKDCRTLKIQIVGGLPGSQYTSRLSSQITTITVK